MIGLDTNVILRILMADDHEQYEQAIALTEKLLAEGEIAVIADTALAEIVWVLEKSYKAKKPEIIDALLSLEGVMGFRMASLERFEIALRAYINGKGDFADYLLREQAIEVGCRAIATFDKALLKEEGFFRP